MYIKYDVLEQSYKQINYYCTAIYLNLKNAFTYNTIITWPL